MSTNDKNEQVATQVAPDQVTGHAPEEKLIDLDEAFVTDTKEDKVPVQSDSVAVEDPVNEPTAVTDEHLEKDHVNALDQSVILDGARSGGAKSDGGDEEGHSEEDETSGSQ